MEKHKKIDVFISVCKALYIVSDEMLRIIQFNLIIWGAVYVNLIFDKHYLATLNIASSTALPLLNVNIAVALMLLCLNLVRYVYVYGMVNKKEHFIRFAVDITCCTISILLIINKIFVVKNFFHHFVIACVILILLRYISKGFADTKVPEKVKNMRKE